MRYSKSTFDVSKMGENPFISSLTITVNPTRFKNSYTNDDGVLVPTVAQLEYDPIVKFYLPPATRRVYSAMSGTAVKLVMWIAGNIRHGSDYIKINISRCVKENYISEPTYFRMRAELIRYEFIAPTNYDSTYWINPKYFFVGDRRKKYPHKVRVRQRKKPRN